VLSGYYILTMLLQPWISRWGDYW